MKTILSYLNWKNFKDTYGAYAIANLLICAVSGIFLAVPYDVNKAYESVSNFIILIPSAAFIRNIHYWSAQAFLVLTILHIWDHFKKKSEQNVRKPVWFRLTISIIITFFAMISGFIIKGDADSVQAQQIITKLISSIPFIGDILTISLVGKEGSFQLLYVHHIATATILIFVLVYEHAKILWGKAHSFFLTLILVAIVSYLIQAPLHDNINPVMKGPWYFTGLQEILHNLSRPGLSLILVFGLLAFIYTIPYFNDKKALIGKKIILYSFYGYCILCIIGFYFRGENWSWTNPRNENYFTDIYFPRVNPVKFNINYDKFETTSLPTSLNRKESCLLCHTEMGGFSASHNPQAIGCTSCHGGDPFSADQNQAHKRMRLIPGNLANARQSCGTANCHPEIVERLPKSIMATMSGVVSVDKWVFGEYDHPSKISNINDLKNSPADIHLKNMCASCHLGNEKDYLGPIVQNSRGGGCIACHLQYSDENKKELAAYHKSLNSDEKLKMNNHPSISMKIDNTHCFGCHSRSGRISLSYEGWHETELSPSEAKGNSNLRILDDDRVVTYVSEDVHHTKGLSCIDCHTSYEIMGDGKLHAHKEQQLQIACSDCHFYGPANIVQPFELDAESAKIFALRNYQQDYHKFLRIEKSGLAMVNSFVDSNGTAFLFSKNEGKKFPLKPPSAACQKDQAHKDVACISCHTKWVPRCVECHTEFNPKSEGWDLLAGEKITGRWVEYAGEFVADKPTLGVKISDHGREIIPMMPGMVVSIDKKNFSDLPEGHEKFIAERLYAPANPHTTVKPEKNCKSCHTNPLTLGYGSGQLTYNTYGNTGKWYYAQTYENSKIDNLPKDAWIGFMQERTGKVATRPDIKPFTLKEQKKILLVGACLQCHDDNSNVMNQSLIDFQKTYNSRSSKCILPVGN